MSENVAPVKLFGKLALILGLVEAVTEDSRNDFQKYNYASDEAIFSAVRKHMSDHKVAIIPMVESVDQYEDKVRVTFNFALVDGESGESYMTRWVGESFSKDDKGVNKCATAGMKYFLKTMFLIPTSKADDPDAQDGNPGKQRQQNQQRQRPAPRQAEPVLPAVDPPQPGEATTPAGNRPYNAEQLFARLVKMAEKENLPAVSMEKHENDARNLAITMQNHMNDKVRVHILEKAFGVQSSKLLTQSQIRALQKWIGSDELILKQEVEAVQATLAAPAKQA